ncbi:MAG: OsmC family protein [Bdellovibrionales bacterium]
MKAKLKWKDQMVFEGVVDGHRITMDAKAPFGKNMGPSPKELVALGMGGCTAMDVISLLHKNKQLPQTFEIEVEVDILPTEGKQPAVFSQALLSFIVTGNIEPASLVEAVYLSQSKYCGVSAMLSKSFPISYRIELNGAEVGAGKARFS